MCNPKVPSTPAQVIEGQYLDQQKLMDLLKNVYGISEEGKNNFRVELRLNRYKIYPLEHARDATLTEVPSPRLCSIRQSTDEVFRFRYRTVERMPDDDSDESQGATIEKSPVIV